VEYLHHFSLSEDPFRNDHRERFVSLIPSQTDAIARLDRGVRQGRGLITLIGPAGAGKTAVANHLYEELEDEVFEAAMMVVLRSRADCDWLLQRFAAQLSVEEPSTQREALVGQIYERLAIVREDGRHGVLIIDDAQALATKDTLQELCALVRLEYEERRMLSIVLVGTPVLAATLAAEPELAHHVEVCVNLPGLDEGETPEYLAARVRAAGGDPQILLPGAVAALRELSGGAPGRMNILADNALFEAYAADRSQVARSDIERAFESLGWDQVGSALPALASLDAMAEAPVLEYAPSTTIDLDAAVSEPVVASAPLPLAPEPVVASAPLPLAPEPVVASAPLPLAPEPVVASAPPPLAPEPLAPSAAPPAAQIETELEAVFEPPPRLEPTSEPGAQGTLIMDFEVPIETPQRPMPARAMAAPTEIELEPADALPIEGPPKDEEDDAVDALFMELIED
jgi:DamX protein